LIVIPWKGESEVAPSENNNPVDPVIPAKAETEVGLPEEKAAADPVIPAKAENEVGLPEEKASAGSKFWQIFGGIFVAATFLLLATAFVIGDLSCDRWQVLNNLYPIFAGISAGAFLGSITVRGELSRLGVVAGGGFAVFLLCFYFVKIPERCEGIQISNFRLFDEKFAVGEPGHQTLSNLQPKRGVFRVEDIDRFATFLGFVVSNFSTIYPNRTKLRITVSGLDKEGNTIWNTDRDINSVDDAVQMDIPATVGEVTFLDKMGVRERNGKIVVGMTIECFTLADLQGWKGALQIKVVDAQRAAHNAARREKSDIEHLQIDDRVLSTDRQVACSS
jgi:hypothetical protein